MKYRALLFVCVIVTVFAFMGCDLNEIGKAMDKANKNIFFPVVANEEEVEVTQEKASNFVTSISDMSKEDKSEAIMELVDNFASMNPETQKQVREVLNSTTVTNYNMKDEGTEDAPTAYRFVSQYVDDTDTPETVSSVVSDKANDAIQDLSEDVQALLNTDKVEELSDCLGEIWAGENGLSDYYNQETPTQAAVLVNEIITQSVNNVLDAMDEGDADSITQAAITVMNSMNALEAITGNTALGNFVNLIGQFVNLSGVEL